MLVVVVVALRARRSACLIVVVWRSALFWERVFPAFLFLVGFILFDFFKFTILVVSIFVILVVSSPFFVFSLSMFFCGWVYPTSSQACNPVPVRRVDHVEGVGRQTIFLQIDLCALSMVNCNQKNLGLPTLLLSLSTLLNSASIAIFLI